MGWTISTDDSITSFPCKMRSPGPKKLDGAKFDSRAEGALMILGGVKSAVACFIANFVTEEMIRRLGLQTASQIDQLRRLLSTLPDFILARLPDDVAFVNGNLVGNRLARS
jgi:hypothetical protein